MAIGSVMSRPQRRGRGYRPVLLQPKAVLVLLALVLLWTGTIIAKHDDDGWDDDDKNKKLDDVDDNNNNQDDDRSGYDDAELARIGQDDPAWDWSDDNDKRKWNDVDQFTYANERTWVPNNIYPPNQWLQVGCLDQDVCLGWPDTFGDKKIGWEITANHCIWCPKDTNNSGTPNCKKHHNSPINVYRSMAINGSADQNDCFDVHWMGYEDSSCSFEDLVRYEAFAIERHALQIKQPIEYLDDGTYRIACQVPGQGGRWGRIDFSRGFTQWWFLSHIDLHVPSEHTQEGKRYSGELQMYHTYAIETDGTEYQTNELATVSVFLEAYDDAPDYDVLNRLICQWRNVEDKTRAKCKLESVKEEYPGCFNRRNEFTLNVPQPIDESTLNIPFGVRHNRRRRLMGNNNNNNDDNEDDDFLDPTSSSSEEGGDRGRGGASSKTKSAHDVFIENFIQSSLDPNYKPKRIRLDEHEFDNDRNVDWDAFIQSVYEEEEKAKNNNDNEQSQRELLDYEHVTWHNYFPLLACKTEYYYRYSGSMTIPPCYGRLQLGENNRYNTNNWRVMKDPIRVSQRQIDELHRLIKQRIAPFDDPIRPCERDTAAAEDVNPDDPSKINVARPLQENQITHFLVFCECENWESKWKEDQAWCALRNETQRFYEHPYNYNTSGF